MRDEQDYYDEEEGLTSLDFANEGSALRAGPKTYPCPSCGRHNMLTLEDVKLGYQCDRCADIAEGKYPPY